MLTDQESQMLIVAIQSVMKHRSDGHILNDYENHYYNSCLEIMTEQNEFKTIFIQTKKHELANEIKKQNQQNKAGKYFEDDEDAYGQSDDECVV